MFQTAYSELCEKLTSLDIIPAKKEAIEKTLDGLIKYNVSKLVAIEHGYANDRFLVNRNLASRLLIVLGEEKILKVNHTTSNSDNTFFTVGDDFPSAFTIVVPGANLNKTDFKWKTFELLEGGLFDSLSNVFTEYGLIYQKGKYSIKMSTVLKKAFGIDMALPDDKSIMLDNLDGFISVFFGRDSLEELIAAWSTGDKLRPTLILNDLDERFDMQKLVCDPYFNRRERSNLGMSETIYAAETKYRYPYMDDESTFSPTGNTLGLNEINKMQSDSGFVRKVNDLRKKHQSRLHQFMILKNGPDYKKGIILRGNRASLWNITLVALVATYQDEFNGMKKSIALEIMTDLCISLYVSLDVDRWLPWTSNDKLSVSEKERLIRKDIVELLGKVDIKAREEVILERIRAKYRKS